MSIFSPSLKFFPENNVLYFPQKNKTALRKFLIFFKKKFFLYFKVTDDPTVKKSLYFRMTADQFSALYLKKIP